MAKNIIFTKDDEINGVPITKGTKMSVSESIAKSKADLGVAKEDTKQKREVKDGNEDL